MSVQIVKKSPIDMKLADADDETLDAIARLRKKIEKQEDRIAFVKGLYFISLVDADYTEDEKALVEGSACALGIGESTLAYIEQGVNEDPRASIPSFAEVGDKKFRQQLFEEMATLTYLKGYQLAAEDKAMKDVAAVMGIKDDKAEKIMYELYMDVQGFDVSKKATIAKAAMGGGAIAAGGGGVAAGTAAVIAAGAVAGGGVAAVGLSVKENLAAAHDKKKLQAAIRQQQKDNMTKQEITENLIKAIELAQARLKQLEDFHASKRDIASIELQIANLQSQKAEIDLGKEG